MHMSMKEILMALAFGFEALAAIGVGPGRINLVALGITLYFSTIVFFN